MSIESAQEFKKILLNKEVIVDTSTLLLTGVGLINILPKCNLILPAIVVKELEDKRTHATVGFLAREWLRFLEELRIKYGKELSNGVPIDENNSQVLIKIEPNHKSQQNLPVYLQDKSNDSTILAVAKNISDEGKSVILLSNDVPMRLHATLDIDIESIEYSSTFMVKQSSFEGREKAFLTNDEYLTSNFIDNDSNIDFKKLVLSKLDNTISHSYVQVFLEDDDALIAEFIKNNNSLDVVKHHQSVGKTLFSRSFEQDIALSYLNASYETLPIVSIGGQAGSGKTILTIASALDQIESKKYNHIIVLRSLHEMGEGQDMGFLPGDVDEKMAPWAGAIYDAIDVIASHNRSDIDNNKVKKLKEKVEISPITYLRGRSLSNSFIILEEAQNFSRKEILNILSRAGENSKIVLTWDDNQVDNRFLQMGKNADIWSIVESFKDKSIFAHITLKHTERSKVAEVSAEILNEDFK